MDFILKEPHNILENIDCGIIAVDTGCRITLFNRAAEIITGCAAGRATGRRISDVLDIGSFGELELDEQGECKLFEHRNLENIECQIVRPDGSSVDVLKNARVFYSDSGSVVGAVETLTDISSLKTQSAKTDKTEPGGPETSPVGGLIGSSEPMRQVYRLIRFAADSESTVLITGESGSGKELAARAIHDLSRRAGGPFVAVNCSALPESLLESELFGHVRGAFTGAVSNKEGRFELAGKGTIFLDEIGDISPLIQLKLLRVLQSHEYQRVGESRTRKADVRVITATNRDLFHLVRQGQFREDLFFRLKVFPVALPPLREHKTDIPALLDHFIDSFNRKTGKSIKRIHPEAMKLLLDYCWLGNVRELEHAVEYAFVLCKGPEIGPFELPQEILRAELRSRFCRPGAEAESLDVSQSQGERALPGNIGSESFQRDQLLRALELSGWNQTAAANKLGVSRVTVWNRMKKLGIKRPGSGK
jgi:two-component system, NtrC family, response regulator HydG